MKIQTENRNVISKPFMNLFQLSTVMRVKKIILAQNQAVRLINFQGKLS